VNRYNAAAGKDRVFFVEVSEQAIMDWELTANHNGHIACTHGGESLAGLVAAMAAGHVSAAETAIVDSTAHALKFAGFQDMYFTDSFPPEYGVAPDPAIANTPELVRPEDLEAVPAPGAPLEGEAFTRFVDRTAEEIARKLNLKRL
jgi:threonine synthase